MKDSIQILSGKLRKIMGSINSLFQDFYIYLHYTCNFSGAFLYLLERYTFLLQVLNSVPLPIWTLTNP